MHEKSRQLGSTRSFETVKGTLTYTEMSERLAVALAQLFDRLLRMQPEQIVVTPEWLCEQHRDLAGEMFPHWAGRFRTVNVEVGTLHPPPYYEVPALVRSFCDDVTERLRHVNNSHVSDVVAFLAWVDWRFQWIHPFKDFNGRIGRLLLAMLLYKLALPHVETAPADPSRRQEYLQALRAGDAGDLEPLTRLWLQRLSKALDE